VIGTKPAVCHCLRHNADGKARGIGDAVSQETLPFGPTLTLSGERRRNIMSRLFAVLFAVLLLTLPAAAAAEPAEDDMQSSEETLIASAEETTAEEVKEMPPVVVSATKMETPVREVASSVTIISEEDIDQKQKTMVHDVLRGTPGLDIVRSGGPGGQTSAFLRGAASKHTLVLIDGIEMNDPSSPQRFFNFANLPVDNIERIEILRGPQSTLYGSDAIGGVINIITKKGEGDPDFYLSGEYGSFYTFREKAGVSGSTDLFNYSLNVSHTETDGISSANEKNGNDEEDGYENTSISTRLGLTPVENMEFDFILRYSDAKADLDEFDSMTYLFSDDPNSVQDTEEIYLRGQAKLFLLDGLWEQALGVSYSENERDGRNDIDVDHPDDWSRQSFEGELLKFDWQHNLFLHETNTLTLGVETEEEKFKSHTIFTSMWGTTDTMIPEKSARTTGYYIQDQIKLWDSFFTTLGVRLDDHEEFGSEVTYRIASAYLFKDTGTKVKATYGMGFKAPSLYELFAPADPLWGPIGNADLDPEKSKGWDAGIEQELCDGRILLGATYFENRIEDLIQFEMDPLTWMYIGYMNVEEAETKGVELSASIRPCDGLVVRGNYTYTDTEDKDTGKQLLRRPKDKIGVDVNYQFRENGNVNLGIVYVGKRLEYGDKMMGGYAVVNLAASYDINENLQLFGRVENLLDRDYEETDGYGTPGFSVFGGLKLMF